MYAETGVLFPYFQNFYQEVQQLDDFFKTHKSNASISNLVQTSMVSDYDLGGEGDLFKAPEPIIEEPMMRLDPITTEIAMIFCMEDVISCQAFKATDIDSLQKEQILSEAFYECEKDIFEKAAMDSPLSEVLDIKIPVFTTEENQLIENISLFDSLFKKSVSSGCPSSMEWMHEAASKPSILNFPEMDLSVVYSMRRAFSEGDIKTLGNGSACVVHSPHEQQPFIINNCFSEERREKLSRYRNKKTKRNFGRKIKYACRKALADSQPRIRGRFAKTEESDNKSY